MKDKTQSLLLMPGIWTVTTLLLFFIVDNHGEEFPEGFGIPILLSWIATVPAMLIASIVGLVRCVKHWSESGGAKLFAAIHLCVILVAAYLCLVAVNFPNLGGH